MIKLFLLFSMFITASLYAQVNILSSSFQEDEFSSDAKIITDSELNPKNVYLNYQNDLLIINFKDVTLMEKAKAHLVTDTRVLKTYIQQLSTGKAEYRVRFKAAGFIKPELNEIIFNKNEVIVKLFKSQDKLNGFHQKQKLLSSNSEVVEVKKETEKKVEQETVKQTEKLQNINIIIPETKNETVKTETKPADEKLIKAQAFPISYNFIIIMLVGGGLFYLYIKKFKKNQITIDSEIKIISNKFIGNKKQLLVVNVNGANLLLGASENGITLISRFDETNEKSEKTKESKPKFQSKLDEEINSLEETFYDVQKVNPYQGIQKNVSEDDEIINHIANNSRKLKNIKKL